jgi:hypothetical protein
MTKVTFTFPERAWWWPAGEAVVSSRSFCQPAGARVNRSRMMLMGPGLQVERRAAGPARAGAGLVLPEGVLALGGREDEEVGQGSGGGAELGIGVEEVERVDGGGLGAGDAERVEHRGGALAVQGARRPRSLGLRSEVEGPGQVPITRVETRATI